MRIKLSRFEAAYLEYILETEGFQSPEAFLRQTIRDLSSGDGSRCLDPARSAFRAWWLAREGKKSQIRCRGKNPVGWCRGCVASLARDGINVEAAPSRAKVSA